MINTETKLFLYEEHDPQHCDALKTFKLLFTCFYQLVLRWINNNVKHIICAKTSFPVSIEPLVKFWFVHVEQWITALLALSCEQNIEIRGLLLPPKHHNHHVDSTKCPYLSKKKYWVFNGDNPAISLARNVGYMLTKWANMTSCSRNSRNCYLNKTTPCERHVGD